MDDKVDYTNPIDVYAAEKKRETEIREAFERKQRDEAQERDNRLFGPDWVLNDEKRILDVLVKKRKAVGISQKDVARKMCTGVAAVSRLESAIRKGKNSPSLNTLIKYVNVLGYRMQIKLIPTDKMP